MQFIEIGSKGIFTYILNSIDMERQRQKKKDSNNSTALPQNGSGSKNRPQELLLQDARLNAIGAKIKDLRIRSGYTSAEIFAYEHELNRISYWRMEKGTNITMSSLFRILDIHQITLSEFFKDIE